MKRIIFLMVALLTASHLYAQPPALVWAKQMSGAANEYGLSVAVDATGNVYTTGYFQGTVNFDPNGGTVNYTAAGTNSIFGGPGEDIFITKYDNTGNLIWARQMPGNATAHANTIAVDGAGNVYTSGFFFGTVDFDSDPLNSYTLTATSPFSADIFVSKLDSGGNFIFAKQLGGSDDKTCFSLGLDAADNIYMTGYFTGTVDFDPGGGSINLTAAGGLDQFVMKLASDGSFGYAKQFGNSNDEIGYDLSVDAVGNVYVAGGANGSTYYGYFTDADVSVLKLDNTGNTLWQTQTTDPGTSINTGYSVTINAGNVYVTGTFAGTLNIGNTTLTSNGDQDIFVARLDDATGMPFMGKAIWGCRL